MDFYKKAEGIGRLEGLARLDSPVHRLHPGAKIITTLVYIGAVISFPNTEVSGLAVYLLYPAVLLSLSGIPWKPLLGRFLLSLPFALMGALSNLVLLRSPVFYIGSISVTAGMLSFVSIMLRTFLAVMAALILIASTSFPDLIRQLTRMGMPKIFGLQLAMTWRYISVLLGEAAAMSTAYLLRSRDQGGIRMKDMGSFLGQLLIRSFDRAEKVYAVMKCRGFEGVYCDNSGKALGLSDFVYAIVLCGSAIFFRFFNWSTFAGSFAETLMGGINR
ncbi:cobalt ECF transporter T component CbiQ [Spirochaetia bacterium]|nr:cobalt ECF transporter T component CbiQ [Spirochaetia bacterium]GHV86488.1 cobalt ECF transporter T component CbiQ [Spirochaetia bacterium]